MKKVDVNKHFSKFLNFYRVLKEGWNVKLIFECSEKYKKDYRGNFSSVGLLSTLCRIVEVVRVLQQMLED